MLLNTLQTYKHPINIPTGQPPCHSKGLSDSIFFFKLYIIVLVLPNIKMNPVADSKHQWVSQVDLVVKKQPANAGDVRDFGSIPGLGRSPGGGQPSPVFLPGESHVQRSLVG